LLLAPKIAATLLVVKILRLVKKRCNDIERQNMLAKFLDKSSLTLCRELNFSWGKKLYIECCLRKETSGIAWLIQGGSNMIGTNCG
jgi:hypothetical protein